MKIDLALLEKMVAAGMTGEAIMVYLRAQLGPQEVRKEKDKLRKRAAGPRKRKEVIQLTASQILERDLYTRAKEVLGPRSGGLISSLIRHHNYNLNTAWQVFSHACTKGDPREYLVATMRTKHDPGNTTMASFDDLLARADAREGSDNPQGGYEPPGSDQGG